MSRVIDARPRIDTAGAASTAAEQAAQDQLIALNQRGNFLGTVSSEAELNALSPDAEFDWIRNTTSFFVAGGLIEFPAGDYYWNGASSWLAIPSLAVPANNRVHADAATVNATDAAFPTLVEIQAFVTAGSITDSVVYYNELDDPLVDPTFVYHVDAAGVVTLLKDGADEAFGDAKVSIAAPVDEVDRQAITITNTNGNGYGISNYLFHLSDDPNAVGTLAGTEITFEQGVPLDLYLVGPSTEGVPADGDLQHNGTVTGIHFQATFNGSGFDYNVIEAVRHHPGPSDYATRTYSSVVAQQTVALTLAETNFDLLFNGFAISTVNVKGTQNLSVGNVCFEETVTGEIESQLTGGTTPNTVFTTLLGSQLNTDVEIMEWVADRDGVLTDFDVVIRQLQSNNAGGTATFTVTNTTTNDSGAAGGNWGIQGATFGGLDAVWQLPDLSSPVPFSSGDVIRVSLQVNNGNSWAIFSQNQSSNVTWLVGGADSPSMRLNGSTTTKHSLEKIIDQETGIASYYDIDGNVVDVSTFTEVDCPGENTLAITPIERETVFDVTGVTSNAPIVYNQAQAANGESAIYDGKLTRHGTLGTVRFKLELDADATTTFDFTAAVPAGSAIVSLPIPASDISQHEIIEDIDLLRVSDTVISFNRDNTIDTPCDFWMEITFDGYPNLEESVLAGGLPANDQSSLGYIDIGSTRIQWGSEPTGGSGNRTITLPAGFADTNYSVVCTAIEPTTNITSVISVRSKTVSDYVMQVMDNAGSQQPDAFMWQAIGLKP